MSIILANSVPRVLEAREAIIGALKAGTPIGLDYETHGPYIQHPKQRRQRKPDALRHRIVGYGVSVGGDAWYVPLRHGAKHWDGHVSSCFVTEGTPEARAWRLLRFLERADARVVCHNWTFEAQVSRNEGLAPKCTKLDSLLGAWMRGMRIPGKGGLKLKPLMETYFNRSRPDFDAVMKGRPVYAVPPGEVAPYCGADCLDAVALWERCWAELSEDERRDYLELEEPTIDTIVHMQAVGVPINRDLLARVGADSKTRMADLRERFRALTETDVWEDVPVKEPRPCPNHDAHHTGASVCTTPGCVGGVLHFKNGKPKLHTVMRPARTRKGADIGSGAQVSRWLWDELGWWPKRGAKPTRDGRGYSTKAEHIKPYVGLEGNAGLAALLRLEYQGLSKYADLYTTGLIALADQWADGYLHTSYLQHGTDTQRFSSSFPNIANIPRDGRKVDVPAVREAFVAPDGWVCICRDYSQAELRVLTHYSRDPLLLDIYRANGDIHQATMDALGIERPEAKITNFSCIYRITARTLALKLTFFTGRRWTEAEAQAIIDGYYERYRRVAVYHDAAVAYAEKHGYARTLTGFRAPLTEWQGRARHSTENRAINYPIQGSVGGIIKRALNALRREWEGAGVLGLPGDARARVAIQAQTYDSINVLARTDFAEEANETMRRIMEASAPELIVPLVTDGGVGPNWAKAK